jgi:hypothetical protein
VAFCVAFSRGESCSSPNTIQARIGLGTQQRPA